MSNIPFKPLRRADRAVLDEAWIENLLQRAAFAVLAYQGSSYPNLKPSTFAYDPSNHMLYFHGANEGETFRQLNQDGRMSVCVSEMGRLLPSTRAKGMSMEFASVIVHGHVHLVDDPDAAIAALQLLLDKYFPQLNPGTDYRPTQLEELQPTAVYCLEIESWSGKQKKVADDYPGAFYYQPPVEHE
jgi:uncharacterized protein